MRNKVSHKRPILPPGTILQHMYLRERLRTLGLQGNFFCEIGTGEGLLSNLLLTAGLCGEAYELNSNSCELARSLNINFINRNTFKVHQEDFLSSRQKTSYDLIISCMVIEHFSDQELAQYFNTASRKLTENGILITLVPAGMKFWGIEDEIAGHQKRYSRQMLKGLANQYGFKLTHLAGLTYPLSNLLLPISNHLVKGSESNLLKLNNKQKTIFSGNRSVLMKTHFPNVMGLVLNPYCLYPFHILQKLFSKSEDSMVLYSEMKKIN